jgi:hypothetical protein
LLEPEVVALTLEQVEEQVAIVLLGTPKILEEEGQARLESLQPLLITLSL